MPQRVGMLPNKLRRKPGFPRLDVMASMHSVGMVERPTDADAGRRKLDDEEEGVAARHLDGPEDERGEGYRIEKGDDHLLKHLGRQVAQRREQAVGTLPADAHPQ